jgi:hypothetical protein
MYGFSVTLPSTFDNTTRITPPTPSCYPDNSNWNAGFGLPNVNRGGRQYTRLPSSDFCSGLGARRRKAAWINIKTVS